MAGRWGAFGSGASLVAFTFLSSAAGAVPPKTATVVAGARYAIPPGGQTWILGENYRTLWTTPIEVDVLDLDEEGLAPVDTQGESGDDLLLRTSDGRTLVFRSVDKDFTHVLPWFLRVGTVEEITQDQLSATVPGVEVVAYPLARALGLIEPQSRLVVLPDDPKLGSFRADFGGRLGVLLGDPRSAFPKIEEIQDADTFWQKRQLDPRNRADSRAFLAARFLDLFLGDWDRKRSHWSWARVEGDARLKPIALDRDQAFSNFNGLAMGVARASGVQVITFGEKYSPLEDAIQNGWDVDRFLLAELDRMEWMAVAEQVREGLTDEVIEEGLRRMPKEYYALVGAWFREALRARREALVALAAEYYRMLAEEVDLQGSDAADLATIDPLEDAGLVVYLRRVGDEEPYFERNFRRDETNEIRIYLHEGDDRVVVKAGTEDAIAVRVVGGPGDDTVEPDSVPLDIWDADGVTVANGTARVHRRPFEDPGLKRPDEDVPWIPSRDWGHERRPLGVFAYHPDAGVIVGAGIDRTDYGFRRYPWSHRSVLTGAFALGVNRPLVHYESDFRRSARNVHLGLDARFTGLDQLRYYGLGNDSSDDLPDDQYQITLYQITVFPSLTYSRNAKGSLKVGPAFKFSNSGRSADDTVLARQSPTGFGKVGQIGALAELRYDSRVQENVFASGFEVQADGAFYPALWDIEDAFGFVDARVDYHRPLSRRVFLSLTAGGKRVFGSSFPFFEAAYIGGHDTTAGYHWDRFAGDASLYGLADLKVVLFRLRDLIPGEIGFTVKLDSGRVWLDGESSSTWHPSYGGGVFFAPFSRFALFEAGVGQSTEQTFFIFRAQAKFLDF